MLLRRFKVLWLILLIMLPFGLVHAQLTNDQLVNIAVNAANQAAPGLGRPDSWTFEYINVVMDTGLGCPTAKNVQAMPKPLAPVIIRLNYPRGTYVIHVSSDGQFIQLCDSKFPTPTPGPTFTPVTPGVPSPIAITLTPTPNLLASCPPDFRGYLPPRIKLGPVTAQVSQGGSPNRLRSEPSITGGVIGQAQPGRRFDLVLLGPVCNQGFVWWQVTIDGVTGWTVESDVATNAYFLEPAAGISAVQPTPALQPTPAPQTVPGEASGFSKAPAQVINTANVANLTALATLPRGKGLAVAWSPNDSKLALITLDGSLYLYSYPGLKEQPLPLTPAAPAPNPKSLAFSFDGKYLAVGTEDGKIFIVEFKPDGTTITQLQGGHSSWVSGLAFSNQGYLLASVSGRNNTTTDWTLKLWDIGGLDANGNAPIKLNLAYPYPMTDVAFGLKDQYVAVTGESQGDKPAAALWVYETASGKQVYSVALPPMQGFSFIIAPPDDKTGDFLVSNGSSISSVNVASQALTTYFTTSQNYWVGHVAVRPGGDPANPAALVAVSNAAAGAPSGDETITFFNAEEAAKPAGALPKMTALDLAFSPDGKVLAVVPYEGGVQLFGVP